MVGKEGAKVRKTSPISRTSLIRSFLIIKWKMVTKISRKRVFGSFWRPTYP